MRKIGKILSAFLTVLLLLSFFSIDDALSPLNGGEIHLTLKVK